jgi:hypothetical protein
MIVGLMFMCRICSSWCSSVGRPCSSSLVFCVYVSCVLYCLSVCNYERTAYLCVCALRICFCVVCV